MTPMAREEFEAARALGRLFCWATLNERQDFMVHLGGDTRRPVREITDEPEQHHRAIGALRGQSAKPHKGCGLALFTIYFSCRVA